MKLPRQLTKRQLVKIVEEIRDILYMSEDTYNEIACSYSRAQTAHFANRLAKEQPTPNENWKDDSVQFPRLLEELQAAGVLTLLMNTPSASAQPPGSYTVWEELQASMDLTDQQIMQIFDRAQKEWDRIKKETK